MDMASHQWGWETAWLTLVGSSMGKNWYLNTIWSYLGLKFWFIDLVVILWVRREGEPGWVGWVEARVGREKAEPRGGEKSREMDSKDKEEAKGWSSRWGFGSEIGGSRTDKETWSKGEEGVKVSQKDAIIEWEPSRGDEEANAPDTIDGDTAGDWALKKWERTWWAVWMSWDDAEDASWERLGFWWVSSNKTWRERKKIFVEWSKHR